MTLAAAPGDASATTPTASALVHATQGSTGHPLDNLAFPLPSAVGAAIVYSYFTWVDPAGPGLTTSVADLSTFAAVTTVLIAASSLVATYHVRPILVWARRLRRGAAPEDVPQVVRHRLLNAPLRSALLTQTAWVLAGLFYFARQHWVAGVSLLEAWRIFVGIALVGGPIGAALSFLVAEFYWRRRIPLFYPEGHLDRAGAIRVAVLARLIATFVTIGALPPLLMLLVAVELVTRPAPEAPRTLAHLIGILTYIACATGIVSIAMALLVARFINRPLQVLRVAMARVAAGDLGTRVPVRSTDELGEVSDGFNAMVDGLRTAQRTRELFGRYVSPAVAQQALDRGLALGGELTHATAMFVDLRGFTALSQRMSPDRVVRLLTEYYALVESACEAEDGIITQFLGDGVVIVFGAPLKPVADHAPRAVRAALALQGALAKRNGRGDEPLRAGIGICTGEMIAGNVGTAGRVTYTIVGDAVNQAARLQVKTRDLDAPILLTESTRLALGSADGFPLQARGNVALKGIAALVPVYAIEP